VMYLGIDPGFSGALAVLDKELQVIHYQDMPIIEVAKKRELDEPELRNILRRYSPFDAEPGDRVKWQVYG
jgi:hypothetical protein